MRQLLALIVPTAAGCGTDKQCPAGCPATWVHVVLEVASPPDGGAISDVEVTDSGPSTGTMSCERADTETVCIWTPGPVIAGTYLLDVVAAGYQETTVNSDLVVTPDPVCGCTGATLRPSHVTHQLSRVPSGGCSPQGYLHPSRLRATNSHSASLGNRPCAPELRRVEVSPAGHGRQGRCRPDASRRSATPPCLARISDGPATSKDEPPESRT